MSVSNPPIKDPKKRDATKNSTTLFLHKVLLDFEELIEFVMALWQWDMLGRNGPNEVEEWSSGLESRLNIMSNLSKVVLLAAGGFAVSIILVVHMSQDADRKRLREGVHRDLERQKRKKDNAAELKRQQELTKVLEEQRTKS